MARCTPVGRRAQADQPAPADCRTPAHQAPATRNTAAVARRTPAVHPLPADRRTPVHRAPAARQIAAHPASAARRTAGRRRKAGPALADRTALGRHSRQRTAVSRLGRAWPADRRSVACWWGSGCWFARRTVAEFGAGWWVAGVSGCRVAGRSDGVRSRGWCGGRPRPGAAGRRAAGPAEAGRRVRCRRWYPTRSCGDRAAAGEEAAYRRTGPRTRPATSRSRPAGPGSGGSRQPMWSPLYAACSLARRSARFDGMSLT